MTVANIKKQALALKPAERIRLVQEIWDSIAAEPENVEVPEEHLRLIEERLREHERDPSKVMSLPQVKRKIQRKLARARARRQSGRSTLGGIVARINLL
jgi:putative addiction module component (TIGR02574 family)